MINEFKAFIARGNVIDLAVGVIIGAALNRIVQSLVEDMIMPIAGVITGGNIDFSDYFIPLSTEITEISLMAARKQGAVLAYGSFISSVINFFILAIIVFFIVKLVNKIRILENVVSIKSEAGAVPADIQLLSEIRDLLKVH
ncbi:large conductance mechanosensitive channel protein MscL [Liberibacter crescens]|uniref:large conductance mechanosensitive channel protein MscL n=1 Tax=Liberibacter crescens TaxID=1273132 RepID=UPI00076309F5|nr:large conductance mechanosensitive channel protein MscL [Liberibacter crescens]AMC13180.1 mechanosensitive ion channel protein MscL [Liberibacter crescens]